MIECSRAEGALPRGIETEERQNSGEKLRLRHNKKLPGPVQVRGVIVRERKV
jgi:hypothetical protein